MTTSILVIGLLVIVGMTLLVLGVLVAMADRLAEPLRHMVSILGQLEAMEQASRRPPRAEDMREQARYN